MNLDKMEYTLKHRQNCQHNLSLPKTLNFNFFSKKLKLFSHWNLFLGKEVSFIITDEGQRTDASKYCVNNSKCTNKRRNCLNNVGYNLSLLYAWLFGPA